MSPEPPDIRSLQRCSIGCAGNRWQLPSEAHGSIAVHRTVCPGRVQIGQSSLSTGSSRSIHPAMAFSKKQLQIPKTSSLQHTS